MAAVAPIHLVAFGAVTSVGGRACVAMAAAQAGLSRITTVPDPADDDDDADACHVAQVSTLAIDEAHARGQALLHLAIEQALAPLPGPTAGSLLVCVTAPGRLDAGLAVARQLARRYPVGALPELETDAAHGSAPLFALERAMGPLSRGELDFALIAAIDLRADPAALVEGKAAERIIGPGRSFGHVPGEGASAVLVASERGLRRLGLPSRGTLLAATSAREPHPMGSGRPCVGTGVTQAVRQALAHLPPGARIDGVTCDLNGERFRTDEWGFTIARVVERLREPDVFVAPVVSWGDCGAANGPLLLALATSSASRSSGGGAHLLVWTSSDGDERAAALVRAAPPPATVEQGAGASAPPAAPPPWARELDAEILSEMAAECAFRYEQRAYLVDRLAGEELVPDWRAVARAEELMDILTRGLAECGAEAREIVIAAVDPEEPGSAYVAARTLLESGTLTSAVELSALHVTTDPRLAEAVLLAFQHVTLAASAPSCSLPALIAVGPALAVFAVEVAASEGTPVPSAALAVAAAAVTPEGAVPFIRALGQLATPEAWALLPRWNDAVDPAVRQELAVAEIRSSGSAAHRLLARAADDPVLLLPAALVVDARQIGWFLGLVATQTSPDAILAAGVAGDPSAIPWLLDRLVDERTGAMAACALELLLGTAPVEEKEILEGGDGDGDGEGEGQGEGDDGTAPLRRIRRVSRDRQAWSAIADPVVSRHRSGLRLRNGGPANAAGNVALLLRPHLPVQARRYLAHELAVRWGVRRPFDPRGLWRAQCAWLFAADAASRSMAPGSWDLPRGT